MARLRSLIRHWLGVDDLARLIDALPTAQAMRILELRTEFQRATTALAADLIAAKRTTTQRLATSDEDIDPHMGYN